jgi:hypothetical protein
VLVARWPPIAHHERVRSTRAGAVLLAAVLGGCSAAAVVEPPIDALDSSAQQPKTVAALVREAPELPAEPMRRPKMPEPTPMAPFALNLYHEGDFVPQHTFEWCVGASMQMTLNILRDPNTTSAEEQGELWLKARSRSNDRWGGASGHGWATVLNEMGVGPYELTSFRDYGLALREAALALRITERPVGLIVWRGRHAWLMSGFTSLGDPAVDKDFTVTGIHVLDPLYPHGDDVWGPSPVPSALLTPDELGRQFKARDIRNWGPESPAGYVMVMPMTEPAFGRPAGAQPV